MSEERLQQMKQELNLLNIAEISEITGWCDATIRNIMDDDDFPVIKIGKDNLVSFEGLKEYLRHRRIKRGKKD